MGNMRQTLSLPATAVVVMLTTSCYEKVIYSEQPQCNVGDLLSHRLIVLPFYVLYCNYTMAYLSSVAL